LATRFWSCLAFVSIFGTACGGESESGPGADATDAASDRVDPAADHTEADAGADAVDSCPSTCAEANGAMPEGEGAEWECALSEACGEVGFQSAPGFVIAPPYELSTPDAARCALEAMRDGREVRLRWGVTAKLSAGVSESRVLLIRPDRIVLSTMKSFRDISHTTSHGVTRLRDPSYFTDCLSKTDADSLYRCFVEAADVACL
jgi:hypothetical protein